MAKKYELNYDWGLLGPNRWDEYSEVTLQVDLHSYERGNAVWESMKAWWNNMDQEAGLAFAGGCRFPEPVRVTEEHITAWIISSGEDCFDSIAHYAEELRGLVEVADPEVNITWTELPHCNEGEDSAK